MELNLSRKIIKVTFEGETYQVRAPSNAELKTYVEKKDDGQETTFNFLEDLGLPAAICWELDPESLAKVVEAITPQKKT